MGRKTLADLFLEGDELKFEVGDDFEVVWVAKPNTADRETAARKASAAKATLVAQYNDHDSEQWLAVWEKVLDYGDDPEVLARVVMAEQVEKFRMSTEAELGEEEEWSKDGYLESLKDAWLDGLGDTWAADTSHVEGSRVKADLDRFNQEVDVRVVEFEEVELASQLNRPLDALQRDVAKFYVDIDVADEWVRKFQEHLAYLCTRQKNAKRSRYFGSWDEFQEAWGFQEIRNAITEKVFALMVDGAEGKGSPAPAGSSPSSEQADAEEAPSGPAL